MKLTRREFLRHLTAGTAALLCGSSKLAMAARMATVGAPLDPKRRHSRRFIRHFPGGRIGLPQAAGVPPTAGRRPPELCGAGALSNGFLYGPLPGMNPVLPQAGLNGLLITAP
ncbi:MAG: twin-arginine translocation signal domain-containing protein [Elusimicrobia bacterium]|nr:twin-arginine translocation signal domain-containing protein [Elusimicrobiota bacterium]